MSKPTGLTCSSNQFTHKETQKQKQSFVVHIYLVTHDLNVSPPMAFVVKEILQFSG